jgi:large subunit ribosomal protein L9
MAKNIEVLLKEDVLKVGSMGDVVAVKPGFARNYLLPEGKAVLASSAAKRQIEVLQERARKLAVEHEGQALALRKQIDGLKIQIAAKVSHDLQLFGSVGMREIAAAVVAKGHKIDHRQVHLHEPIKQLGRYQVIIGLYKKVEATVQVEVVNADPNGPTLDEVLAAVAAKREEIRQAEIAAKEAAKAAKAAAKAAEGAKNGEAPAAAPAAVKAEKSEKSEKPAKGGKKS